MISLYTSPEIICLREGGRRLAGILKQIADRAVVGVAARELDRLARELIAAGGDRPAFLNYQPRGVATPYPAALCVSVNDTVVHGIPGDYRLQAGDIVGLDLGLEHAGLFTDMAVTVPVGVVEPAVNALLQATQEALAAGIRVARGGRRLGDIGAAIEGVARARGYGLVRDLGGHGVGHRPHEAPLVPNFGKRGTGLRLKPGMVLAVEPMFNGGSGAVNFLPDGYTVKTADGSRSAHFEYTVLITDSAAEVLTAV